MSECGKERKAEDAGEDIIYNLHTSWPYQERQLP
jgi:hypothetical protein